MKIKTVRISFTFLKIYHVFQIYLNKLYVNFIMFLKRKNLLGINKFIYKDNLWTIYILLKRENSKLQKFCNKINQRKVN
jgi:hypothetical protein